MSSGSLQVLNCGRGDLKVSFEKDDPLEVERARRIIEDMLKRGYSLFIDSDGKGKLVKVQKFDPATNEYIIADGAVYSGESPIAEPVLKKPDPHMCRQRGRGRGFPIKDTKVIAIAPTAGG